MGLEDIDEDDCLPPPPVTAPPRPAAGAGMDLDDIFGGQGKSVVAQQPAPVAMQASPNTAQTGANAGGLDSMDMFFGNQAAVPAVVTSPNGSNGVGGGRSSSNASPGAGQAVTGASGTKDAFLDDIFGGGGGGGSTGASGSPSPMPGASMSPPPQADAGGSSLMDFKRPTQTKQHQRTEADLIEEMLSGKKKTTNTTTLKDIAGSNSATSRAAQYNPHLLQLMSHYDILGVSRTAPAEEIHKAYKKKSVDLHPDRAAMRGVPLTTEEEQVYKLMTTAHEILMDEATRAEYDRQQRSANTQGNWLQHV